MSRMDVLPALLKVALFLVALRLLVWWLEPRMAFYPLSGVQQTPAAAGISFRDVRVETADGEKLHAWWLDHPAPRAQVVFFHGNGGNLSLWLDLFIELHQREFAVFALDYRGYGASTGRPSERGLYRDADAAVRVFTQQFRRPGVPVIYWGRSMGAPVAAYALSVGAPDAMILETPWPEVRWVLRSNPVLWALSFLSSYRFPTSKFLEHYDGPLLVVHGGNDSIVPFQAGKHVFEQAPTRRKTFVAVQAADHNDLHVADPGSYWAGIDRFVMSLSER
jgi:alpha-beta hydrolase superfamily lysophospholipase